MNLYLTPSSIPELADLPAAEQKALYKTLPRRGLAHLGGISGLIKKHPWMPVAVGGLLLLYLFIIFPAVPSLLKGPGFLIAVCSVVLPIRVILFTAGRGALQLDLARRKIS